MPMEALMMRHADRAPIEVRVSFETTRLSAQHLINAYRHLVPVQRRSLRSTRRRGLWELATRQWIEPQLAARRDHVDQLYGLMRENERGALASRLAEEWLNLFPD